MCDFASSGFQAILKGFLNDFSNECRDLGDYMVNAAVDIYDRIARDLLPTPSKSHYIFNLRDLSKCVQGVTQADAGTMRSEMEIMRLFYHECLRVFHDRCRCGKVKKGSGFGELLLQADKRGGQVILLLSDEGDLLPEFWDSGASAARHLWPH